MPLRKTFVDGVRFGKLGAGDLDAGSPQCCQAAPGNAGIRVLHCRHDPRHAALDQRFRAGGLSAGVATRLQRHVDRRTANIAAGIGDGGRLGMGPAGALVPAAADHGAVAHDDAADAGILGDGEQSTFGQLHGATQEQSIDGADHGSFSSVFSLAISSWNSLMS